VCVKVDQLSGKCFTTYSIKEGNIYTGTGHRKLCNVSHPGGNIMRYQWTF